MAFGDDGPPGALLGVLAQGPSQPLGWAQSDAGMAAAAAAAAPGHAQAQAAAAAAAAAAEAARQRLESVTAQRMAAAMAAAAADRALAEQATAMLLASTAAEEAAAERMARARAGTGERLPASRAPVAAPATAAAATTSASRRTAAAERKSLEPLAAPASLSFSILAPSSALPQQPAAHAPVNGATAHASTVPAPPAPSAFSTAAKRDAPSTFAPLTAAPEASTNHREDASIETRAAVPVAPTAVEKAGVDTADADALIYAQLASVGASWLELEPAAPPLCSGTEPLPKLPAMRREQQALLTPRQRPASRSASRWSRRAAAELSDGPQRAAVVASPPSPGARTASSDGSGSPSPTSRMGGMGGAVIKETQQQQQQQQQPGGRSTPPPSPPRGALPGLHARLWPPLRPSPSSHAGSPVDQNRSQPGLCEGGNSDVPLPVAAGDTTQPTLASPRPAGSGPAHALVPGSVHRSTGVTAPLPRPTLALPISAERPLFPGALSPTAAGLEQPRPPAARPRTAMTLPNALNADAQASVAEGRSMVPVEARRGPAITSGSTGSAAPVVVSPPRAVRAAGWVAQDAQASDFAEAPHVALPRAGTHRATDSDEEAKSDAAMPEADRTHHHHDLFAAMATGLLDEPPASALQSRAAWAQTRSSSEAKAADPPNEEPSGARQARDSIYCSATRLPAWNTTDYARAGATTETPEGKRDAPSAAVPVPVPVSDVSPSEGKWDDSNGTEDELGPRVVVSTGMLVPRPQRVWPGRAVRLSESKEGEKADSSALHALPETRVSITNAAGWTAASTPLAMAGLE